MKKFLFILFTLLSVSAFTFKAADVVFSIEDDNLVSVPDNVIAAILSEKRIWDGLKDCSFAGKKLPLSKDTSASFYAVTTTEACGWGAASGPIWIIKVMEDKVNIILSGSGNNLLIDKGIHDDMPDIVLDTATAGHEDDSFWSFDKDHYKRIGSTSHPPGE